MAEARVTKIICPCCNGGENPPLFYRCMWCGGEKRIPADRALKWARMVYAIAGGGYVSGDHDFDMMLDMERKAAKVLKLLGLPVEWTER